MLSILAVATAPVAQLVAQRAKERELKASLVEIRSAIDAFKRAYDDGRVPHATSRSGFPVSLDSLVDGVLAGGGQRLYFLRRIPRDPFSDPATPAANQWGLRSYESSADHPMPGADVYDIYSLTPGLGLDGTPYRQW
jgi:general secretion pathway protein G